MVTGSRGDFGEYTLYRDGTGTVDGAKHVSYTAVGATRTVSITFTGEQPTMDGIAKMLGSLKEVTPSTPG
jgi:hypothetical protein